MNKLLVVLLASLAMPTNAALLERGGGLIYDDVLNITWLQDANYAKTSGYDADGMMTWANANTWADTLVYHDSVRNVDYSDWRLPTVIDTDTPNCNTAYSGTDCGWNVQTVSGNTVFSELAHMYYVSLGNLAAYDVVGVPQSGFGLSNNPANSNDESLFNNLQAAIYWTATEFVPPSFYALGFDTSNGYQDNYDRLSDFNAWAVRDGDVAAIPEPSTYVLMLAGLGMLGVAVRRNSKQVV